MDYRILGGSGLYVPPLCFGTATFGGIARFKSWGTTDTIEAQRLLSICFEHGVNFYDTADVYSQGLSEEILGQSLPAPRDKVILSTKATFSFGEGPNNMGSSRHRILQQIEGSLRRLKTDYIDVYHMHGFDAITPVEETLRTLDDLVSSGKVRYLAASNFSGWHLMKSQGLADRYGWSKYVAHQIYYSLTNREYEWELMPLGIDQKVGALVWSPLAGGRLGGKFGRNKARPAAGRVAEGGSPVPDDALSEERLFRVTDALEAISDETGKSIAQIAINWLLQRPTVSSVIIGARTEEQLVANLGATGWDLTPEQVKRLDAASEITSIYPYWHQRINPKLNPEPDFYTR